MNDNWAENIKIAVESLEKRGTFAQDDDMREYLLRTWISYPGTERNQAHQMLLVKLAVDVNEAPRIRRISIGDGEFGLLFTPENFAIVDGLQNDSNEDVASVAKEWIEKSKNPPTVDDFTKKYFHQ